MSADQLLADMRALGRVPATLLMRRHGVSLEAMYELLVSLEARGIVRVSPVYLDKRAKAKTWEVA